MLPAMKIFSCFLMLLLLGSCFAPKKVRRNARAERLVEKATRLNPDILKPVTVTDTVVVRDTVIFDETRTDTILQILPGTVDTVVQDRTEVVIRWREGDADVSVINYADTVYLTDTIIRKIDCPPQVVQTKYWRWVRSWRRFFIIGIVAAILLGLWAAAVKIGLL
jgi:hypothetical protein